MIHYEMVGNALAVGQNLQPPCVYLDHWALRGFSEDDAVARKFSTALKRQGGTLALSWLNVAEFSKVDDDGQRRKADELLDAVAPNLFWLNPDFFSVIRGEELPGVHDAAEAPHSDLGFARAYVEIGLMRSVTQATRGFATFCTAIRAASNIPQKYDEVADIMVSQIERLRDEYSAKRDIRAAVNARSRRGTKSRGTRIIARELIGRFLKDRRRRLIRNDVVDLSHAVVSVTYCDYVLLDGQWAAMVNDVRKRFGDAGMSFPMAKVFSKKSNGVEKFLAELETFV